MRRPMWSGARACRYLLWERAQDLAVLRALEGGAVTNEMPCGLCGRRAAVLTLPMDDGTNAFLVSCNDCDRRRWVHDGKVVDLRDDVLPNLGSRRARPYANRGVKRGPRTVAVA